MTAFYTKPLLFSFFFLLIFSTQFSKAQTFEVKGRVIDSESLSSLDGVSVTLKGTAFGDISMGGGNFSLEEVREDKYTLSLNLEGYNRLDRIIRVSEDLDLGEIVMIRSGAEGSGSALQKTIRATNITRLLNERPNFSGGNMIYGIAPDAPLVEGNNYLDEKWNTASLLLYKDQKILEGYRTRYNIQSNVFELLEPSTSSVFTIQGLRVQNVVWVDSTHNVPRYFVNGMDFLDEGTPISGFFEVLVDGELPLLRRTLAVFKESNYNTALMVGNRNHEILKRNTYYYLDGKNVIEVPKKTKKVFALFGEKAEQIEEYADSNSLSLRKPTSLFQIFTQYNSMFDGFKPIIEQLQDEK